MTLRYDNYDTLQTQYCHIDDELMRRACHVGPINDTEAIRRARVDAVKASQFVAKMLTGVAGMQGLVKGDRVSIGGQVFELE